MKALTLWRPWSNAILRWGKDIENRTWAPRPQEIVGNLIALHNDKQIDGDGCGFVLSVLKGDNPAFGIDSYRLTGPAGYIVGVVRIVDVVRESQSRWFCGPVGWVLVDPFELPNPVRCRGAQGLWPLPADVQRDVLGQLP